MLLRSLAGSRAKITRAKEQIEVLRTQLRLTMEDDATKLILQAKHDTYNDSPSVTIYVTQMPTFSTEVSVQIGEIVHNLRSGLDHLAWALVPQSKVGSLKPREVRDIMFPLVEKSTNFPSSLRRRIPVALTPEQYVFIERHQPYKRTLTGRLMRALQTLSNTDKHRIVVPTSQFPLAYHADVECVGAKRVAHFQRLMPGQKMKVGTEMSTWTLTAKPQSVNVEYRVTATPAFHPSLIRPRPGNSVEDVTGFLLTIAEECSEILAFFET